MRRTRTRDTYCAHHGVNRGHNSAECMVISQEFAKYHDIIYEILQTRGLGTNETGRGGRGHKSSRLHPSYGRGQGRGGGIGELPQNFPPNFPPDFPQDLPPGQFPYGPRHAFAASYPYDGYRGYSGWGEATGHWSPPWEDAHGYGLGGCERSFGESPYGDDGGRYSFGHPPYDGGSFKQQRETTGGESSSYGLSETGSEVFQMGTHQLHLTWFTYNCYTESYTPQPVDLTPIPQLLPYMQSFFSFGQHVIYQTK